MNFTNMFSGSLGLLWWGLLLAVPPAIVLLYFLKLKRQPLEVPSTYLWHKSIEDLHVNSIWQKLRQNLLLFLQLLLILLAILSLLRPSWSGTQSIGQRVVFIIDNSASMSATDVQPTRLEEAKRQVLALIEEMPSDGSAMVISFADGAQVVQNYTTSGRDLRQAVQSIKPTERPTDLLEALRVASGLANPNRTGNAAEGDVAVAEAMPAVAMIFSDGRFVDPDFVLGNLEPKYYKIGDELVANVGVGAFSTTRSEEEPTKMQAFGRIDNFGPEDQTVLAELYLDDALVDVVEVEVPAGDNNGAVFPLDAVDSAVLRIQLQVKDALQVDDAAWTTINSPRRAKVLLVTPGNEPLELALENEKLVDLVIEGPSFLQEETYQRAAAAGLFDLIIYDRCLPPAKGAGDDVEKPTPMPLCNTLFIAAVPKLPGWGWKPGADWPPAKLDVPVILDVERSHPLMQLVELGDVHILEGIPLEPPSGGRVLIDSSGSEEGRRVQAGMLAIGPREGYEDLVMGFDLVGEEFFGTDWSARRSFPVFTLNLLTYFGGGRNAIASTPIEPGQRVEFSLEEQPEEVTIIDPAGNSHSIPRSRQNTYYFTQTDRVGVYQVRSGSQLVQRFAVNLFNAQESNLPPREEINIRFNRVQGQTARETTRREAWKWLLLLALLVLLAEWYIYNRRVYL